MRKIFLLGSFSTDGEDDYSRAMENLSEAFAYEENLKIVNPLSTSFEFFEKFGIVGKKPTEAEIIRQLLKELLGCQQVYCLKGFLQDDTSRVFFDVAKICEIETFGHSE